MPPQGVRGLPKPAGSERGVRLGAHQEGFGSRDVGRRRALHHSHEVGERNAPFTTYSTTAVDVQSGSEKVGNTKFTAW